jgi:hypothetical protein
MSVFVVPLTPLTAEVVLPSDFRALDVTKVLVDVVTVTDTNNVSFALDAVAVDSVAIVENSVKIFNGTVDFDPTDPDTDPDPINIADNDAKAVGKTLTDAAAATDADAKTVGQVSTDAVTTSEAINTKDVGKALTDSAAATEVITEFNTAKVVADSASITDAAAKELTRPDVADSIAATDDSFRAPVLGKTDSVAAADTLDAFDIGKNPSDTVAATDAVDTFAVDKVLTDSVIMTEFVAKTPGYEFDYDVTDADADPDPVTMADAQAFSLDTSRTDTASVTDADAKTITKPNLTDSVSGSDAVVVNTDKVLTDTASASDAAALTPGKVLSDSISTPTDAINTFAVGKYLTDSFTPADAINTFAVTKVLTDTATTSDVLVTNFVPGNTVPFVDFTVIADDKFTYSAVPGVLNAHLIHEPLVNGEFVLTTDPNAGIVYTIRTESEYTFAGYQVNGNQLN